MPEKSATQPASSPEASLLPIVPFTAASGQWTVLRILRLIWEFTESNFGTFVVPNTCFGVLGALGGASVLEGRIPTVLEIGQRVPTVVVFNWYSVLIFDLANQRSAESIREDVENKPWRPIPSGKVTAEQTRRAVLVAIPAALLFNYLLGVWKEGAFIYILTWLYNDLGGGDELVRDAIISAAYGLFNTASLRLAAGPGAAVSGQGLCWTLMVSGVVLTTMQVQDLKDQAGDKHRRRKTIPLAFGDAASRWAVAGFVPAWSCLCAFFWRLHPLAYTPPVAIGAYVALRVLQKRSPREDSTTWKCWCLWTASLYLLPAIHRLQPLLETPGLPASF